MHGLQDVSGGKPVRMQGTDLPIYGMEIDVAAAAEEIRSIGKESDGSQVSPAQGMSIISAGISAAHSPCWADIVALCHVNLHGKDPYWLFQGTQSSLKVALQFSCSLPERLIHLRCFAR